ncbi:DedA family protein [Palleronia sp. KMU-117]|uniref:DedA family protein n=1 Tax=Palleronia sp. KMU-117 TaxID=3434108 RepID=UPI003D75AADA
MTGWLDSFVQSYGTLAVFAGTAIEGEAVAMTGGIMAHQGHTPVLETMIAAAAGGYLSDLFLYWMGRTYRDSGPVRRALEHKGVAQVVGRLSKNLVVFALTFRFLPGMKTAGAMSLATLGMRPLPFALCAAISAVVWAVLWVGLGYLLGHAVERLFGDLERVEHALIAPAILGAMLWLGVAWWRRRAKGAAPAAPSKT